MKHPGGEKMIRSFNGKTPKIADSAFISEAAYIVGDVEIGENSSVWPHAVIRGDTGRIVIGRNTAIEDCVVIHAGGPDFELMVIGDMVNIGHSAVIHCAKIGNNVLVGMNATVLQKAEIGNHCLIGAGCLVSEGMVVPDDSFVAGIPGKIKGKVMEKQSGWLGDGILEYARYGRKYKAEGLGSQ
jgi:carbonic anhydrase/acetyltransferase-like protein (isoleucine patch superfamily)